jgi:6-phosphogluconolactonase
MTTLSIRRFASRAELDGALAARLGRALTLSSDSAPVPAVMLSGGSTPMPAYRELGAQHPTPAAGLRILFTDERYVPATSTESNYHQTLPLLDALALPGRQLLRVRTELPLAQAADDYERQLGELLQSGAGVGLGLLGLGADGHTASLFGPAELQRAQGHLAISVPHRPDGMSAVSVTPGFLAQVREPLFVVAGAGKEQAVQRLMARDPQLTAWAAVQGCAAVELWVDEAAAGA